MSVDFFDCDVCGEPVCECGEHWSCECGKHWCSIECAESDGYEKEEDPNYEDEEIVSCKYCREEDFEDDVLLEYALEKLKLTREELLNMYKSEAE